jgi:hypothetical protein
MAQAVNSQPLTVEAQVCTQFSPCGILDGQSNNETGSLSCLVFPCQYHSAMTVHTYISSGG